MNTQTIRKNNIKECLEYCQSLTKDEKLIDELRKSTHEQRVVFLLDNGFSFPDPESTPEEDAQLEKLYRGVAKIQKKYPAFTANMFMDVLDVWGLVEK